MNQAISGGAWGLRYASGQLVVTTTRALAFGPLGPSGSGGPFFVRAPTTDTPTAIHRERSCPRPRVDGGIRKDPKGFSCGPVIIHPLTPVAV